MNKDDKEWLRMHYRSLKHPNIQHLAELCGCSETEVRIAVGLPTINRPIVRRGKRKENRLKEIRRERVIEAARLARLQFTRYYIAKQLGVSMSAVNTYLRIAKEEGLYDGKIFRSDVQGTGSRYHSAAGDFACSSDGRDH